MNILSSDEEHFRRVTAPYIRSPEAWPSVETAGAPRGLQIGGTVPARICVGFHFPAHSCRVVKDDSDQKRIWQRRMARVGVGAGCFCGRRLAV